MANKIQPANATVSQQLNTNTSMLLASPANEILLVLVSFPGIQACREWPLNHLLNQCKA